MTEIRVIHTRKDYEAMRAEMERLLDVDPPKGAPDRDRLDVLLVLLAEYEARESTPATVDPVDAIQFRMDQLGLAPRDLEPFLGGRSRVSEVLSRKRPLSIAMIRALHEGLGIPAEALIVPTAPPGEEPEGAEIPWERFPLRELIARGWIDGRIPARVTRDAARDLLAPLFPGFDTSRFAFGVLYRRSVHVRAGREMDVFALAAWTARVRHIADARPPRRPPEVRSLSAEHIRSLVQLSSLEEGPRLAVEWLSDRGITVVVEQHLPRTRLDGAALLVSGGRPVVALTLRHDRLDNFWFTLLHEIGHIVRHLLSAQAPSTTAFYDDLDVESKDDPREQEADEFARESLVPAAAWAASAAAFVATPDAAKELADDLGISPAVVAGRVRHEKRNFRLLGALVGAGEVRRQFLEAQ